MTINYKGWLPTVTGRLSFSFVGESKTPRLSISANRADATTRYVISFQRRVLSDTILPFEWVPKYILKLCGSFVFVCISKSSNDVSVVDDCLVGSIAIISEDSWKSFESTLVRVQQILNNFADCGSDLLEKFDSTFIDTIAKIKEHSQFCVDFKLERDGEVKVIYNEDVVISKHSPSYPDNIKERVKIIDTSCAQCFYFLRDIVHRHQHHSPATDTLIDLYKEEDDIRWRTECLRVLYRKIVDFKRRRKDEIYCSSLGLLAYAKSFRQISEKKVSNGTPINPIINDELLDESIRASQTATSNSIQAAIKRSDALRNTMIGVIGLFISFASLVKLTNHTIDINPTSLLAELSDVTVWHPLKTFVVLGLAVYGVFFWRGEVRAGQWRAIRSIFQLLQAFPKLTHVICWFMVSVLSVLMFYFIIKW